MPRGRPKTSEKHLARGFVVRDLGGGKWGVRQGTRQRVCHDLTIQVTVTSQQLADGRAVLTGVGVVRTLQRGAIVVTA